MLLSRPVGLVLLTAAALVLASCASQRAGRGGGGEAVAHKAGIYKVGQPYTVDGTWY
jgi:hypothetical protein